MKKVITIFLAILLILCSLCTLAACDSTYDMFVEEYFEMGYSEKLNKAFVANCYWGGQLDEDMDIFLPNTYKGAPVTALGGFTGTGYPNRFRIDFYSKSTLKQDLFGNATHFATHYCELDINLQDEIEDNIESWLLKYDITKFEIKDVTFNLHIGSNLQEIKLIGRTSLKEFLFILDEEKEVTTVFAFSFIIIVDEQNENFYSDELGRMYYKESGKLVNNFLYHNRDTFPEGSLPTE